MISETSFKKIAELLTDNELALWLNILTTETKNRAQLVKLYFPDTYDFLTCAKEAKQQAVKRKVDVQFMFNNICCKVNEFTDEEDLFEEYNYALLNGWSTIESESKQLITDEK